MRRKPFVVAVSVILAVFLPVALLGLMLSVNEYRDQGIGGAVDCNGPLTVMLFNVPPLLVYAAGAVYYGVLLKGARRRVLTAALLALCVTVAAAAGGKAWAAYGEKVRPEHQETCGEGW